MVVALLVLSNGVAYDCNMLTIIGVIASIYLLIEFLSRTEQGVDGKIRFNNVPRWYGIVKEIFYTPSAKSSVVEVEVKTIEDAGS